jgi:cyclopropane-fatty-acyl-phospholipid synthase
MNRSEKRLDTLRRLLAHVRERLAFDVGFLLWDGSTIPAHLGPSQLAISIADEGAIAALIRRPNVDTFINLWVGARLDIRNGSIFDVVARRPKVSTKATLRTLDKRLVLATAASYLFVSRGAPGRSRAFAATGLARTEAKRRTRRTCTITTTSRTRSTRSFSIWR